ncbi:MAG: hypothetical protein WCG73_00940 [Candidatus Moraniibacteriota bacterium]
MTAPFFSIFALVAEFCVTGVVFYVIWKAVGEGRFNRRLGFGVLAYEVVFNISYMVMRSLEHANEKVAVVEKPGEVALAAFHGIFSLVMFIALVIFFTVAAKHYAKGENFFVHHHRMTSIFLYAWGISVFSGALLFVRLYI